MLVIIKFKSVSIRTPLLWRSRPKFRSRRLARTTGSNHCPSPHQPTHRGRGRHRKATTHGADASRLPVRLLVGMAFFDERRIFAWRGVGMIHGEVLSPRQRTERIRGFMRPVAAARNKLNDLAVHENISQSTMRISPPRASAIRQAVAAMPVFFLPVRVICLVKNAAEPRVSRRLSSGANPISLGRVRGRGRRVRARRQTGSDGGALQRRPA